MPTLVATHNLKNFDDWAAIYAENPPPPQGTWRVLRGVEDPNRVYVIGEIDESEVEAVKAWAASDEMLSVFAAVNDMSNTPLDIVWTDDA